MKITAPAALPGEYASTFGSTVLTFRDGEAEVDELPDGLRAYLASAGYGIDGSPPRTGATKQQPTVDARDATGVQVGTLLRDAAVDPQPEDFLAPVNAGQADPHGPSVVSPGIHAEGERIVAAGPVSPDPAEQEAKEKRLAEKLLIDNEQVREPSGVDWKDGMGPLGLSDPLSAEEGVRLAAEQGHDAEQGEPKGNASRDEWAAFATSKGASDADIADMSRDELRALYGS